jgi:uncharacterized protein YjiS (DUF1127 family)
MDEFELVMNHTHPNPQLKLSNYINVTSFVDWIVFAEFTRNVDAYRFSLFFSKDRNEKLYYGPIWDYDLGLGICSLCFVFSSLDFVVHFHQLTDCPSEGNANWMQGQNTSGWSFQYREPGLPPTHVDWISNLITHHEICSGVARRWQELRRTVLNLDNINARVARDLGVSTA